MDNKTDEKWLPVPSKPGIMASSWGRVLLPSRKAKMPHGGERTYIPKPTYGNKTKASKKASHLYYGMYALHFGNLKIHRLVCEAFHGEPPEGKSVVIHKDDNALNNKPENLKWGTQKENLNMPGFKAFSSKKSTKINHEMAESIRKRHASGENAKDLAEEFKVTFQTIHAVISRSRGLDKNPEWR